MNRRQFLGLGGAVGASALCGGAYLWSTRPSEETADATEPVKDAPDAVEQSRPLAQAFHEHIRSEYPDARVFITEEGGVVMDYSTEAESKESLKTEFRYLAVEFASVVKGGDHTPKTFTAIANEVQAIASKPTVKAYVAGEINQEAFEKTVEVTGIERRS